MGQVQGRGCEITLHTADQEVRARALAAKHPQKYEVALAGAGEYRPLRFYFLAWEWNEIERILAWVQRGQGTEPTASEGVHAAGC